MAKILNKEQVEYLYDDTRSRIYNLDNKKLNKQDLPTVDSTLSSSSTNPVQNKVVTNSINQLDTSITNLTTQVNLKANQSALTSLDSSLSTVAKSGKYEDLTGLPTLSEVASTGMYEDLIDAPVLATVATSGSYNDLSDKPSMSVAVTVDSSLSSTSTNPVQNKVIHSALAGKAESSHTHTTFISFEETGNTYDYNG